MKKLIIAILLLSLCMSLTACKSEDVKAVEQQISEIGTVTLQSENAIVAAENAFNALSEEDRQKVENAGTLTEARSAYEKCLVSEVETIIEAIGVVNIDSYSRIVAAWTVYEELPDPLKASVQNFDDLVNANNTYAEMLCSKITDANEITPEDAYALIKDVNIQHEQLDKLKQDIEAMIKCSGIFYQNGGYETTVTFYIQYGEYWMDIDYPGYSGYINEKMIQTDGADGFLFKTNTTGGHINFLGNFMSTNFTIRFGENKLYIEWGSSNYYLDRTK